MALLATKCLGKETFSSRKGWFNWTIKMENTTENPPIPAEGKGGADPAQEEMEVDGKREPEPEAEGVQVDAKLRKQHLEANSGILTKAATEAIWQKRSTSRITFQRRNFQNRVISGQLCHSHLGSMKSQNLDQRVHQKFCQERLCLLQWPQHQRRHALLEQQKRSRGMVRWKHQRGPSVVRTPREPLPTRIPPVPVSPGPPSIDDAPMDMTRPVSVLSTRPELDLVV